MSLDRIYGTTMPADRTAVFVASDGNGFRWYTLHRNRTVPGACGFVNAIAAACDAAEALGTAVSVKVVAA